MMRLCWTQVGLAVFGLLLFFALTGCIRRQAPQVSYYSLFITEQLGDFSAVSAPAGLKVGVGPVAIPDSLKRSQIVTRGPDNVYQYDEYHRWADLLEHDIGMVLAENLEVLLGTQKVASSPWRPNFDPTHRVVVDVLRFDGELAGEAVLTARWALTDASGKQTLDSGKVTLRQPVAQQSYQALVKAESRLLAELSKVIAAAILDVQSMGQKSGG